MQKPPKACVDEADDTARDHVGALEIGAVAEARRDLEARVGRQVPLEEGRRRGGQHAVALAPEAQGRHRESRELVRREQVFVRGEVEQGAQARAREAAAQAPGHDVAGQRVRVEHAVDEAERVAVRAHREARHEGLVLVLGQRRAAGGGQHQRAHTLGAGEGVADRGEPAERVAEQHDRRLRVRDVIDRAREGGVEIAQARAGGRHGAQAMAGQVGRDEAREGRAEGADERGEVGAGRAQPVQQDDRRARAVAAYLEEVQAADVGVRPAAAIAPYELERVYGEAVGRIGSGGAGGDVHAGCLESAR